MQVRSNWEREAQRRLQPLFQRLAFVPREELRSLSRRISQLERYVRSHQAAHAELRRGAAYASLNSLKHADLFWDEV